MNLSQAILISILAEGALVVVAVLGVWVFLTIRRRGRDVTAAQTLVESVRREEASHLSRIHEVISRTLQGENPSIIAKRLLDEERNFYKHIIQVYLKRDAAAFAVLPDQIKSLAESYQQLLIQVKNAATSSSHTEDEPTQYLGEESSQYLQKESYEESYSSEESNQYLEEENTKLSQEIQMLKERLQLTLETMNKMIQEYSGIYGKDCISLTQTTNDDLLEAVIMVHNERLLSEPTSEEASSVEPDLGTDMGSSLGADFGSNLGVDLGSDLGADFGSDLGVDLEHELDSELEHESPTDGSFMGDSLLAEFSPTELGSEESMESLLEEPTSKSDDDFLQEDLQTSTDTLDFDALELEEILTDPKSMLDGESTSENLSKLPEPTDKGHIRDVFETPEKIFLHEPKPKNKSQKR